MLIGRDAVGSCINIGNRAQEYEISWRRTQDNVARIEQALADQVQECVAARSDDDLLDRQMIGFLDSRKQLLSQFRRSRVRSVLQRGLPMVRVRKQVRGYLLNCGDWQRLLIDKSRSQRDEFWVLQRSGHQFANWRSSSE